LIFVRDATLAGLEPAIFVFVPVFLFKVNAG
jgi:hypothetical protein